MLRIRNNSHASRVLRCGCIRSKYRAPLRRRLPNQAQPPGPRVRISTGVMLGLVKHKTMPVYPDEAMKKGIQGDVILKIEADETGKIIWSAPVEGDPLLVDASMEALKTFRFAPYLLNGAPVKFESQLGFHFSVAENWRRSEWARRVHDDDSSRRKASAVTEIFRVA
jgi:TonB family protein